MHPVDSYQKSLVLRNGQEFCEEQGFLTFKNQFPEIVTEQGVDFARDLLMRMARAVQADVLLARNFEHYCNVYGAGAWQGFYSSHASEAESDLGIKLDIGRGAQEISLRRRDVSSFRGVETWGGGNMDEANLCRTLQPAAA